MGDSDLTMTRRLATGEQAQQAVGDPVADQASSAAGPSGLADIIGRGPAAVLLVDLRTREVVHASPVAEQLAPATALPVGLDEWSRAAQLRDRSGAELAETDHPLSRVARAEPVEGQAVSAARRSDLGSIREPLWVVAVPMTGAPGLASHSLVVLLPLRQQPSPLGTAPTASVNPSLDAPVGAGRPADPWDARLSERAALATGLSFTIADARQPDQPLVWVNPAFTAATGYELDDVIGRNCRFLQGAATDRAAVEKLRTALDAGEPITVILLNYRKDDTPFWNQLDVSPILDPTGQVSHFVGIQTDVSARVDADRARERALESERISREAAETAQRRLRFLFDTVDRLTGSMNVAEIRDRLFGLVLPEVADWAVMLHRDHRHEVTTAHAAHADSGPAAADGSGAQVVAELAAALPAGLRPGRLADVFFGGGDVLAVHDLDDPDGAPERGRYLADASLMDYTARLGGRSAVFVALPGPDHVEDVMVLVRGADRRPFSQNDIDVVRDLGRRVGLMIDNARLFEIQANIAGTLQRSLLPALPDVPGVLAAARYSATEVGAVVGGDFYELLDLPHDGVGFAIGDVSGHDIGAAAAMGHLQGLIRACAHQHYDDPARVLEQVDTLLTDFSMTTMATAIYGHLRATVDGWELRWAVAGHPPLAVRHRDGTVALLTPDPDTRGPLLGMGPSARRHSVYVLPPHAVLLAYTDGLIERRNETMDVGLDRLTAAVAAGPAEVGALCDFVLSEVGSEHDDDVAVLALHLGDPARSDPPPAR